MSFLNTQNVVHIFPSALRSVSVDPTAKLTSENNFTKISSNFTDKKSYIIKAIKVEEPIAKWYFEINIEGYYLEFNIPMTTLDTFTSPKVYATIKTGNPKLFINAQNNVDYFETRTLIGQKEEEEQTFPFILDDNSIFYGLSLNETPIEIVANDYIYYNLLLFEYNNSTSSYEIATTSRYKYDTDSVFYKDIIEDREIPFSDLLKENKKSFSNVSAENIQATTFSGRLEGDASGLSENAKTSSFSPRGVTDKIGNSTNVYDEAHIKKILDIEQVGRPKDATIETDETHCRIYAKSLQGRFPTNNISNGVLTTTLLPMDSGGAIANKGANIGFKDNIEEYRYRNAYFDYVDTNSLLVRDGAISFNHSIPVDNTGTFVEINSYGIYVIALRYVHDSLSYYTSFGIIPKYASQSNFITFPMIEGTDRHNAIRFIKSATPGDKLGRIEITGNSTTDLRIANCYCIGMFN